MLIFDAHLDLAWNAIDWNRDLRLPVAAIRQREKEQGMTDKGRGLGTVSFHELRHTYASHLAQAGVDLLTISKLLGHADTRMTSTHYAHLADKTLAAAVTRLPSFVGKVSRRRTCKRFVES